MIPWLALFWTVSALIGDLVVGPNLIGNWLAWHDYIITGAPDSVVISAWTHVRTDAGLLFMLTIFLLFGLVGLTRPVTPLPQDWQGWVTTALAMTLPWTITAISYGANLDRHKTQRRILTGG